MSTNETNEINKIDITQWLDSFGRSLKRLWWAVILLTALCTAYNYFHVKTTYVPNYTAEATLTISSTSEGQAAGSDNYTNVQKADQLQKVFASIVESGTLDAAIAEDLEMESVPGSYSVTAVEGTNMLTITATANDGETAYAILQAVINDYPEIAQVVVGQTYAVLLDDSGVPEDTGMSISTRGSIRKGIMIGLLISLLVLLVDMFLQRTVRYESDFTTYLHTPCLGILPEISRKKRKKGKSKEISILAENIPYGYLEAIRSLRSRMERRIEKTGEKTFLVTSSIPSEGKSTVAANLAAAFGRKGKKVVLVDCDLRHPSVQEKLGIPGTYPGLESILKGKTPYQDSIYKMPGLEVYVLCGAQEPSENIDILGGTEMEHLIHQLESFADIVILDTSPSAMLADAITLARNVPLALYVVRCDYVKVRNVLDGIEELSETGINIIGAVLNFSQKASRKSSGSSGYGYGYGYGKKKYGYGSYGYGSKKGKGDDEAEMDDGKIDDLLLNHIESSQAEAAESSVPGIESASAAVSENTYSPVSGRVFETVSESSYPARSASISGTAFTEPSGSAESGHAVQEAAESSFGAAFAEAEESGSMIEEVLTESAEEPEESHDKLLERLASNQNEIEVLQVQIELVEKFYQVSPVLEEYHSLTGVERKKFYQDHISEINEYNQTVKDMRSSFAEKKVPSLRSMKSEMIRLQREQEKLKERLS